MEKDSQMTITPHACSDIQVVFIPKPDQRVEDVAASISKLDATISTNGGNVQLTIRVNEAAQRCSFHMVNGYQCPSDENLVTELEERIQEMSQMVDDFSEERKEYEAQIQSLVEENNKYLRSSENPLNTVILKGRIHQLEKLVEEMKHGSEKSMQEIVEERKLVMDKGDRIKLDRLEEDFKEMQKDLEKVRAQRSKLEEKLEFMELVREKHNETERNLRTEINKIEEEKQSLTDCLLEAGKDNTVLTSRIQELEDKVLSLKEQRAQSREDITKLKLESSMYRSQTQTLECRVDDAVKGGANAVTELIQLRDKQDNEIKACYKTIEKLRSESEEKLKNFEEREKKSLELVRKLKKEFVEKSKAQLEKVEALEHVNNALKEKIAELEREKGIMTLGNQDMETYCKDITAECSQLKAEVEELRAYLDHSDIKICRSSMSNSTLGYSELRKQISLLEIKQERGEDVETELSHLRDRLRVIDSNPEYTNEMLLVACARLLEVHHGIDSTLAKEAVRDNEKYKEVVDIVLSKSPRMPHLASLLMPPGGMDMMKFMNEASQALAVPITETKTEVTMGPITMEKRPTLNKKMKKRDALDRIRLIVMKCGMRSKVECPGAEVFMETWNNPTWLANKFNFPEERMLEQLVKGESYYACWKRVKNSLATHTLVDEVSREAEQAVAYMEAAPPLMEDAPPTYMESLRDRTIEVDRETTAKTEKLIDAFNICENIGSKNQRKLPDFDADEMVLKWECEHGSRKCESCISEICQKMFG